MTYPKDIREFRNKYGFGNIPIDKRTKAYKIFALENNIKNNRDFLKILRDYMKKYPNLILQEYLNRPINNYEYYDIKKLKDLGIDDKEIKKLLIDLFNKYIEYQISNKDFYIMFSMIEGIQRPLNLNTYYKFIEALNNDEALDIEQIKNKYKLESNAEEEAIIKIKLLKNLDFIEFWVIKKTNKNKSAEGAFFPYFLNSNVDLNLNDYQIYKEEDNKENFKDNCFIFALRKQGLKEEKLEIIKSFIKNQYFKKSSIKEIALNLNIRIDLYEPCDYEDKKQRLTTYNKNSNEIYKICLIENHYIKYDKDIFKIIRELLKDKEKYFTPITYEKLTSKETENLPKITYSTDLYYDEKIATKEIIYNGENDNYKDYSIIYFDFEAYEDENNNFKPYLICASFNGIIKSFFGFDCGLKFFNNIKKNSILIAHNTKFDISFLMGYFTTITKEIKNDGFFKELQGFYYKTKLVVRDSYCFIPKKLKEFPECFMTKEEQKEIKKEIMPYKLYNKETIEKQLIPLEEIKPFLNNEDFNEMIENSKKWFCLINNKIDILRYSMKYCEIDVKILELSYNKFRQWCKNDFNMDIINYITISSFVDAYFKKEGCYKNCFKVGLNIKDFIMKTINGGRVMLNNNEKQMELNEDINDFDAVSLYPSAMKRMDGFLIGTPNIIINKDYNNIKNYDGYFVEILIKKVGIKRDFPLMSYKDKEGVKNWINEMENKIIYVDKYTLEDLIEFQKIEFEIIRGYYYNKGFNKKINETIQYLFNKRKELKKEENPAEIIYKLMMNSVYGKTLQKDIEKESKFFTDENEMKSYISKNYNIINSVINYDKNRWKIEILKSIGCHFNACHIGSMILSMSKRIMNEVMTTAEDNKIKIYYQDTDSIHIKNKDIKNLVDIYECKYNRKLIGKELGQFHSDFKLGGSKTEVISKGFIGLGKKCYIDKLESYNEKGELINGFHTRLKGINNEAIEHKCQNENINKFELYLNLYKGDEIEFDLTAGGDKAIFKFSNNYTVSTVQDFKRKIKFN